MIKLNKICIIDDDRVHTFILNKLIEKLQLCDHVVTYPNGEQALEAFKTMAAGGEAWPEVILLDINMPEMDGWEFMHSLKNMNHLGNSSFYISSSSISLEDQKKAEGFPEIKKYLIKPIEPQTLLDIVQKSMAEASA